MPAPFLVLVLGALSAFGLLFCLGGNDVANSIGVATGAGALPLSQAVLLAAVHNVLGALLAGRAVTANMANSIIPSLSDSPPSPSPATLLDAIAFLCALLSTIITIATGTLLSLPLSSTHAVVGGIVGACAVVRGLDAVNWHFFLGMALAWIVSPAFGFCLTLLIRLALALAASSRQRYVAVVPAIAGAAAAVAYAVPPLVGPQLVKNFMIPHGRQWVLLVQLAVVFTAVAAATSLHCSRRVYANLRSDCHDSDGGGNGTGNSNSSVQQLSLGTDHDESAPVRQNVDVDIDVHANSHSTDDATGTPKQTPRSTTSSSEHDCHNVQDDDYDNDNDNDENTCASVVLPLHSSPPQTPSNPNDCNTSFPSSFSSSSYRYRSTPSPPSPPFRIDENAPIFRVLLIFAVPALAFAHGSNDVSNGVGPFFFILSYYLSTGHSSAHASQLTLTVVVLCGGIAIACGIVLFGGHVMATIGRGGISTRRWTFAQAFAAQMAAAAAIVSASALGVPVGTSHCVVGAVMGTAVPIQWPSDTGREDGIGKRKEKNVHVVEKVCGDGQGYEQLRVQGDFGHQHQPSVSTSSCGSSRCSGGGVGGGNSFNWPMIRNIALGAMVTPVASGCVAALLVALARKVIQGL